ncbi:MAG: YceI family protein [Candidatus Sericytochromatia bacterium]|nr:YceI family protein [Candidatus Sericytochromatia bacterium]
MSIRPYLAATLGALLLTATPAMAATRSYVVEQDMHSVNEVSFTSKAAIVKFVGRTAKFEGEAQIDPSNPAKASGKVIVDLPSLDTGISLRNEHMRGALETEKFPKAVFAFDGIRVPGNRLPADKPVTGMATGSMTIHGVTKKITVPVELTLLPQQDASYRAGDWVHVTSQFKLKVTDYGVQLPKGVFGLKVAEDMDMLIDGMAKAR